MLLEDEAGVVTVGQLMRRPPGSSTASRVCPQGLALYDLAEQWTEAMERWCETNAILGLHGRCRVHRAEILRLRGSRHEAQTQVLIGAAEAAP